MAPVLGRGDVFRLGVERFEDVGRELARRQALLHHQVAIIHQDLAQAAHRQRRKQLPPIVVEVDGQVVRRLSAAHPLFEIGGKFDRRAQFLLSDQAHVVFGRGYHLKLFHLSDLRYHRGRVLGA
jgi:hypothetical protein